jgi:hypothetical protein
MDRADQAGIEELHRKDVGATLASDSKLLAELWTDDAVRLQPGGPAEVGLTVIRENDRKQRAEHPAAKVLSYGQRSKMCRSLAIGPSSGTISRPAIEKRLTGKQ